MSGSDASLMCIIGKTVDLNDNDRFLVVLDNVNGLQLRGECPVISLIPLNLIYAS